MSSLGFIPRRFSNAENSTMDSYETTFYSPSSLARESNLFLAWAAGARIMPYQHLDLDIDIVRNTWNMSMPDWLLAYKGVHTSILEAHAAAVALLKSSAQKEPGSDTETVELTEDLCDAMYDAIIAKVTSNIPIPRDAYTPLLDNLATQATLQTGIVELPEALSESLRESLPTILASCYTINELDNARSPKSEYAWRRPVDDLIESVFYDDQSNDEDFSWDLIYDADLSLPKSVTNISVADSTKAATSLFISCKPNFFGINAKDDVLELLLRGSALKVPYSLDLNILSFAAEFSSGGNRAEKYASNGLVYDLGSAQYQRRALGFKDHSIYGVSACRGVVRAFVSWWDTPETSQNEPEILVEELTTFDLRDPMETFRFYIFLDQVKKDAEDTYHADLETLQVASLRDNPDAGVERWRSGGWTSSSGGYFNGNVRGGGVQGTGEIEEVPRAEGSGNGDPPNDDSVTDDEDERTVQGGRAEPGDPTSSDDADQHEMEEDADEYSEEEEEDEDGFDSDENEIAEIFDPASWLSVNKTVNKIPSKIWRVPKDDNPGVVKVHCGQKSCKSCQECGLPRKEESESLTELD